MAPAQSIAWPLLLGSLSPDEGKGRRRAVDKEKGEGEERYSELVGTYRRDDIPKGNIINMILSLRISYRAVAIHYSRVYV